MCEEVPRQKAAESRKIPESGSVIPREGVESPNPLDFDARDHRILVIPREGVESRESIRPLPELLVDGDPERGS